MAAFRLAMAYIRTKISFPVDMTSGLHLETRRDLQ